MPRYINPQVQYFTDLGLPLTGGKLFFYEPSTLIAKNTYSDSALSIPNTNPIVLSTGGSPVVDIWLNGVYRVILKDSSDNVIWDKDPVGGDSSDRLAYQSWVAGISYNIGDIVTGSNDRYYVSITEPNLNNNPVSSSVNWTEHRLMRVYNANESYAVGVIVQDASGFLWRCIAPAAGSTPVLGSAFWSPALPGYSEINALLYPVSLAGPANLAKNKWHRLTTATMHTLPLLSSTVAGEIVILSKDPDVNPTIQAQTGEKIRIGSTPTNAAFYDNFLYSVTSTIVLTSIGTEWELN